MRSFWKGPVLFNVNNSAEKELKIISRNTTIFPSFIGKYFLVKNGENSLRKIQISVDMVGLKIGEFVITKKVY
uniref:Ribosomal protein S19 n=1 Tax=Rhodomonas salina TaxID=3034 RepID=Q9G8T6_RHDSA|nr:ribosomal protein S19 [Rhodomonas salina]AAG17761.1 ribosomal protein S19 [Rhodomonas salina]